MSQQPPLNGYYQHPQEKVEEKRKTSLQLNPPANEGEGTPLLITEEAGPTITSQPRGSWAPICRTSVLSPYSAPHSNSIRYQLTPRGEFPSQLDRNQTRGEPQFLEYSGGLVPAPPHPGYHLGAPRRDPQGACRPEQSEANASAVLST